MLDSLEFAIVTCDPGIGLRTRCSKHVQMVLDTFRRSKDVHGPRPKPSGVDPNVSGWHSDLWCLDTSWCRRIAQCHLDSLGSNNNGIIDMYEPMVNPGLYICMWYSKWFCKPRCTSFGMEISNETKGPWPEYSFNRLILKTNLIPNDCWYSTLFWWGTQLGVCDH